MPDAAPLLEAIEVSKRFGEFVANDRVSLSLTPGEKHALLGENGAGKSTLVKMIYGLMAPSSGGFRWQGAGISPESPAEARALGIGMVFQHFSVFDALTVAENIALALPSMPIRQLTGRIAELSAEHGLTIDPHRRVHTLSVGEKQRVEIIRCLMQDPKLLIMDEPTSVLTPQEADLLFATLERLAAGGCAILYISHKLEEVRRLCDRATVLRQGRVVATCDPGAETAGSLAEMMIGTRVAPVERTAAAAGGAERLSVVALSLPRPDEFGTALGDVSFSVRGGEIVGIAGIAGEGQDELMDALSGERLAPAAGAVRIDGAALGRTGPVGRRRAGAAFVPEQRNGHAAIADMTLPENLLLTGHGTGGLVWRGLVDMGRASRLTEEVRRRFDVRSGTETPVAGALSGGNLQKFVVGREILRNPGVLVVSQPTWGVDAGAAVEIRQALIALAEAGSAVLVISQDLDEIFAICDRVAVIHHGRLSAPVPVSEMTPQAVGLLMGGAHPEQEGAL